MGYERNPRGDTPQGDHPDRLDQQDYGRDYGSGRDYTYSSARDYQAAGNFDRGRDERDRDRDRDRPGYAQRDHGGGAYQRGRGGYGRAEYAQARPTGDTDPGDGRRSGRDDAGRVGQDRGRARPPQGYEYDDRGFLARAGDEVRSWFGDEEAERRREADLRHDERGYGTRASSDRDSDYHHWRSNQISALDRDYDEYRREHRSKFESEFSSWRTNRQGQRDRLGTVTEHMEVVGSDGAHVGTVDKVRGDRIMLTKKDKDAHGRHHSIPSSWIHTVDTTVTLAKTADEAQSHWRDEERNQAMFGDRPDGGRDTGDDSGEHSGRDAQGRLLNRSFSGTY